jgi:prepilin-type N-terminal cleavage/methylation domain-containing protein
MRKQKISNGFTPLETKRGRRFLTGFTLVELLIVVVIIGVMASLVIPRTTGQTEHAYVAEAVNMLGAMRRAQLRWNNENGTWANMAQTCFIINPPTAPATPANWTAVGMQAPPCTLNSHWSYGSSAFFNGQVYAGRTFVGTNGDTNLQGRWIWLEPNGTWGGTGSYAPGKRFAPRK